jgi:hypothetical protein
MVLEKKILKRIQCIFTLLLLCPLEKVADFHLDNVESSLHKDYLCHISLSDAQAKKCGNPKGRYDCKHPPPKKKAQTEGRQMEPNLSKDIQSYAPGR